jgi:L-ribulose-5-phosphate 3-epimerase
MSGRIGFMQGRLSPIVDNKIQCFPWGNWKDEIIEAERIGFSVMEWTLDQDKLYENPLMTNEGQIEIIQLCQELNFSIPSLTGDCFMQSPFWKIGDFDKRAQLERDFLNIAKACNIIGIEKIVVPLVDNGSIQKSEHENVLIDFLLKNELEIKDLGLKVIFESDFNPLALKNLMAHLKSNTFGINYDTGNSAALDFEPEQEFSSIGQRILNVHIKDRVLNGTTVCLGDGNADFPKIFKLLKNCNYNSDYILQTARAIDGNHVAALLKYKNMVSKWIHDLGP